MDKGHWAYDLHIHSALSPCGDNDMTPNNIVNMSLLKGLDIISITDHNSAKNLPAIIEVAKDKEIVIIPGIEVNTKEEVHLLCYFPTLDDAMAFDKYIESYLPHILNNKEIFGEQLILNSEDKLIGQVDNLLINALHLSIDEIFSLVKKWDGVVIPAHIDRDSYSIISNLGFIPSHLSITTLELSSSVKEENFKNWLKKYKNYQFIQSSDAHSLEKILERQSFLTLNKVDIKNFFDFFNRKHR
jgi:hypothetical protein